MKQKHINATLKRALPLIAALALTTLLILTALPQAGATAPAMASLSTNPKRINESAAAHSFIRSSFVDSTPGTTTRVSAAPRPERQPLESLTGLKSIESSERGAPLGVFSVPSVASVVQSTATPPAPPTPHTPPNPPLPPLQPPPGAGVAIEPSAYALDLPPLEAVLLVGPIDGDDGSWTTQEKQNMDLAAAELEANAVTVYKFYTPNNDWEQIKAVAEEAHFLFYRGHGVYWSPLPHPTVGGFALKNRFVSSDDIRNDLHLAPDAIVMLYGCFTAGSSGIEDDIIDSAEAQRRVAQYSDPFFDIGAAGYYTNWYGNAFQMFVRYLFQGMTLGETYESYFDFNSATVERYIHPDHPDKAMWLDKDFWGGKTQYNNAFVGLPDLTLADLFVDFPDYDFNQNCIVDVEDIMQVASHWYCKCEDACYHSLYDLDGDCIITVVDIMLVVVHWGETCG